MLMMQGTAAYLLTWIDPPRRPRLHARLFARTPPLPPAAWLAGHETRRGAPTTNNTDVQAVFTELAAADPARPMVLIVRAPAVASESGRLLLLPPDANPDDRAGSLPLGDLLEQLKACPAQHKLLVLDLGPAAAIGVAGFVYHDLAAAIQRELEALPDADRLVLSSCAAGQTPHGSPELGRNRVRPLS